MGDSRYERAAVDPTVDAAAAEQVLLAHLARTAFEPRTVELLRRVLDAIVDDTPLVIEGPPGIGKTDVATLAGRLLRLPVTRVNLSSGLEATELLGRYMPAADRTWAPMLGPVARGVAEGHLVVLDEFNTAPAGVVDALLPVLEQGATTFHVPDLGQDVVVHPRTRFVATINTVGEVSQGRLPLSRPMRSRIVSYFPEEPDHATYVGILQHLVTGRAAKTITVDKVTYDLPAVAQGVCHHLADVAGFASFVEPVGRFVHDLAGRCADRTIGADRREGYVVDRRLMIQFVRALDRRVARLAAGADVGPTYDRCFKRFFLESFCPGVDRDIVREQAEKIRVFPAAGRLRILACPRGHAQPLFGRICAGQLALYQDEPYEVDEVTTSHLFLNADGARRCVPREAVRGFIREDDVVVIEG